MRFDKVHWPLSHRSPSQLCPGRNRILWPIYRILCLQPYKTAIQAFFWFDFKLLLYFAGCDVKKDTIFLFFSTAWDMKIIYFCMNSLGSPHHPFQPSNYWVPLKVIGIEWFCNYINGTYRCAQRNRRKKLTNYTRRRNKR